MKKLLFRRLSLVMAFLLIIVSMRGNTYATELDDNLSDTEVAEEITEDEGEELIEEESFDEESEETLQEEEKDEVETSDDTKQLAPEPKESMINTNAVSDAAGQNCVTFYSSATFSLAKTSYFATDGTIQFLAGNPAGTSWANWADATISAAVYNGTYYLSLRGVGATYVRTTTDITGDSANVPDAPLTLSASESVDCSGYIEALLDYQTVESGNAPTMAQTGGVFTGLFTGFEKLIRTPRFTSNSLANTEYAYAYMFYNCYGLSYAPNLPATILGNSCYRSMFENCTGITKPMVSLPATVIPDSAYRSMFKANTSLSTIPTFNLSRCEFRACYSMFYNCTTIRSANISLPSDIVMNDACFGALFYGCSALKSININFPNHTEIGCYQYMFYGCTSLTAMPNLPAKNVAERAYSYMFYNCDSITSLPDFNLTSVGSTGMMRMFYGCKGLVTVGNITINTLGESGANTMFSTSSVQTVKNINVKIIGKSGLSGMFNSCKSLNSTGTLTFETLGESGCSSMFGGASALKASPVITGGDVPESGFRGTFSGCTSLKIPGKITVGDAGNNSFRCVFQSCTALLCPPAIQLNAIGGLAFYYAFEGCSSIRTYTTSTTNSYGKYTKLWKITPSSTTVGSGWNTMMFANCAEAVKQPTINTNYYIYNFIDITATDVTKAYTGNNQTATITVNSPSGATVTYCSTEGGTYTTSSPTFKTPGIHPIYYKVTLTNYETMTGSFNLIITKNTMETSATGYSGEYDGNTHTGTITKPDGAVVKYSETYDGTYTTTVPQMKNVGFKTVYYQITKDYYYDVEGSFDIIISKINMSSTSTSYEETYDGAEHKGSVTVSKLVSTDPHTIEYSVDGGAYTTTEPAYTDICNHTINYKVTSDNYNDATGSYTIKINKADIVSEAEGLDIPYDGAEHTVTPGVTMVKNTDAYTIQYSVDGGEYTATKPAYTDVCDHAISYKITSDNYNDFTGSYSIKINPLNISATAASVEVTYDGEAHKGVVNVESTLTPHTIYYSTTEGTYTSTEEIEYTNAGTHIVYYKVVANNYNDFTGSYTIKINNATMTVEKSDFEGVYDGSEHTGSVSVTVPTGGYLITYSTTENGTYVPDIYQYTNAGTYVVYYNVTADNYDMATGSFTVKINNATMSATAENVDTTYDGENHTSEVTVSNPVSGYTIYYSDTEGTFTSTEKVYFKNAGEHRVYYKVVAPNYDDLTGSFLIKITSDSIEAHAEDVEVTYDGSPHSGEVVITKPNDGSAVLSYSTDGTNFTEDNPSFTDAGTYPVHYKIVVNNFDEFIGNFTVKINKATMSVNAEGFEGVYDSQPHTGLVTAPEGATITYCEEEEGEYSADKPTLTGSGTKTVYYKVTKPNYNDVTGNFTITITNATMTVTATNYEGVFDNTPHTGTVNVTSPATGYTIYYSTTEGAFTNTDPITYTNAGEHTVYYKVVADNYDDVIGNFTISITKADIVATAENVSVKYDGEEHAGEVVVTTPSDGYTIFYSEDEGESYTDINPTYVPAGEYLVYYKVTAPNYNDFEGQFTVTIVDKEEVSSEKIYIMYNPNSGEHLFTSKLGEYNKLATVGWVKEGVSFYAYTKQIENASAIYRVYNPNAPGGDHHYTKSLSEVNKLVKLGWKKDNGGRPVFYAKGDVKVYKLYNKGNGRHHYTRKQGEYNKLSKLGWVAEGIAWYAANEGDKGEVKE